MRRSLAASFALLVTGAVIACAPKNLDNDDDDDGGTGAGATGGAGGATGGGTAGGAGGATGGGTTGGTGGGTGGGTTGGAGGATGGGTAGGAGGATGGATTGGSAGMATGGAAGSGAGAGPVMCSNADKTTLPIDMDGWVAKECNERGIQGPWYCYDDVMTRPAGSAAMSSCVADTVPFRAGGGMCLTGDTVVDATYGAWGAGIALGLNESGDMGGTTTSVKSAYNGTMAGVTGFQIDITGDTGGLPLRIGFTGASPQVGAAPFVQVPGVGSYMVPIETALVPETWTTDPNAGMAANPANIFDMQIQVVGGDVAAHYDFCIAKVTPITDGMTPPMGTLSPYGSVLCGDNFAKINLGSRYMVQNNVYNGGGGGHCIQAAWDNGNNSGFTVSQVNLNIAPGGAPGSYPSVVYGWHVDGQMYGGYTTAKQLSAVASAPTSWTFTVPAGAGRYNASYDIWIHNSQAKPANTNGSLELMVWLYKRDTTPIGSQVGTVMLAGTSWEVWYGTHDGFSTVSYVRTTSTSSIANMDLKPFFSDAVTRGYAQAAAYLLGIQAGFEIWEGNQNMVTDSYSVSVN